MNKKKKSLLYWIFIIYLIFYIITTFIVGVVLSFPIPSFDYLFFQSVVFILGNLLLCIYLINTLLSLYKSKPNAIDLSINSLMLLLLMFFVSIFIFKKFTIEMNEALVFNSIIQFAYFYYFYNSKYIKENYPIKDRKIEKIHKILFWIILVIILLRVFLS